MHIENISFIFIQLIILLILIITLIKEYFNNERKNKNDIIIFIILTTIWFLFFSVVAQAILTMKEYPINKIYSLILIVMFYIGLLIIFIKKHKHFNKFLSIIEFILLSVIVFSVIKDVFVFDSWTSASTPIATFLSTWIGYFIIMDFLIHTSEKRKKKKRKKYFHAKDRKIIIRFFILLMLIISISYVTLLLSVENNYTKTENLAIYNWEDYFAHDTISNFEKEYGINVTLYIFNNADEMERNLKRYPDKYDLIVMDDGKIKRLSKDYLYKLNIKNIKNIKNINPIFLETEYDKKNTYSIPYLWGTTALIINTNYIPENTDTWGVLWSTKYKNKIATLEDTIEIISLISKYVGYGVLPQDQIEIEKVRKFFNFQNNLVVRRNMETLQDMLLNEELWASQAFNGDAAIIIAKKPELKYIIPKEGGSIWVDNFAIPKEARNKYNAELFINYILRPEVSANISSETLFATTNLKSKKLISPEILSNNAIYPTTEEISRLEYFSDYSEIDELETLKKEIWESLK